MPLSPADRLAVADVLAAYARAWDGRDVEAWLALFAADCTFERTGAEPLHGREALRAAFAPALDGLRASGRTTRHLVTNVLAAPEGAGGATATADVLFVGQGEEPGAPPVLVAGSYEVALVRSGDGWLIRRWRYERAVG